jgi:hypothetical protein
MGLGPLRRHLSIPHELKLTRLVRKSRPIHLLEQDDNS